jgi:hypothetical protein
MKHVVLGAVSTLKQQRGRRQPDAFMRVTGADQRHGATGFPDPADDRGEHVGEFGADDQQPLSVDLRRGDLQQGNELAGGGQPVLDQAVMRELGELLNADAFSGGGWVVV